MIMLEAKLINALIYAVITTAAFFKAVIDIGENNHKPFIENSIEMLSHVRKYAHQKEELPCRTTITYTIGTFDDRFEISKDEFKKVIDEAANSWNEASNKKLLAYSPDGEMKVNLAYDIRQEVTSKLKKLDPVLDKMEKDIDAMDVEYERAVGRDKEKIKIKQDISLGKFNKMTHEYNAELLKRGGERAVAGNYQENEKGKELNIFEFESREKLERLLIHEFGHALTLKHTENEGDIMHGTNVATNEKPSVGDVVALGRLCGGTR